LCEGASVPIATSKRDVKKKVTNTTRSKCCRQKINDIKKVGQIEKLTKCPWGKFNSEPAPLKTVHRNALVSNVIINL
jgi:hypothetical protein